MSSPQLQSLQPTTHSQSITPIADLYAIGVMLWECVVGCRLWSCGEDIQQLLTAQLGTRPPLVRQETGDSTIPEAFEQLVAELLATRPERRPQSAVEARD